MSLCWASALPWVFVYLKYMVTFDGRNSAGLNFLTIISTSCTTEAMMTT